MCLLEDVVTTGGALAEAVSTLRGEGLFVRNAVCVVDREGGSDAPRAPRRAAAAHTGRETFSMRKTAAKRHG